MHIEISRLFSLTIPKSIISLTHSIAFKVREMFLHFSGMREMRVRCKNGSTKKWRYFNYPLRQLRQSCYLFILMSFWYQSILKKTDLIGKKGSNKLNKEKNSIKKRRSGCVVRSTLRDLNNGAFLLLKIRRRQTQKDFHCIDYKFVLNLLVTWE